MRLHWPSVAAFALAACALVLVWALASELSSEELRAGAAQYAVWMAAGLLAGLALLLVYRRGVPLNHHPIDDLLACTATRWRWLLAVYLAAALAWSIAVTVLRVGAWPMLMDTLFSAGEFHSDATWSTNLLLTLVFVTLQVAFISGVGRVQVQRRPTPPWRLTASITVFAVVAGLMAWGLVAALLQLTDRISGLTAGRAAIQFFGGTTGLAMLGAWWLFWLCIGWLLCRGVPRETALARMVGLVFAGSWIEFAVALPVELVTREQTKECPCSSGSWTALICAGPVLMWTVGPAIVLLYLHERRQTRVDPAHARRVLQRKSRHARVRV